MAGVSDKDLVRQPGFSGVNNVAPQHALPTDDNGTPLQARGLVNMDLVRGKARTRRGFRKIADGDWSSPGVIPGVGMFALKDGDLVQVGPDGDIIQTVRSGVGRRTVSYVRVGADLLWSNGQAISRISGADLSDRPIGPDCPGAPTVEPYPSGGLTAGNYTVAMTWFDAEGRESGAWGAIEVQVQEGQGIRVFNIPHSTGAASARIYVSPPDGEVMYAAKDLATSVTNTLITAHDVREAGRALSTLWHESFPASDQLRTMNGRLFGIHGRNILTWSPPLHYHLHHGDDYMRFGVQIMLFEPLDNAGAWMAEQKATYWLSGIDPRKDWRRVVKSDKSAVPGASIIVAGNIVGVETPAPCALWISSDGVFCVGTPDGTLIRLQEGQLAMQPGEQGAMLLREQDGLRQIVATFLTRGANALAIGDRASATVTRY